MVAEAASPPPEPIRFALDRGPLSQALADLRQTPALVLPCLAEPQRQALVAAADALPYRQARPVIGGGPNAVHQDFELNFEIPAPSPFHDLTAALGVLVDRALAAMAAPPLSPPIAFNDLIVQRYPVGCGGMTPHRDHLRYRGLVVLVLLQAGGMFYLSDDRQGNGRRDLPARPGDMILMIAPDFAGRAGPRPFHGVDRITARRYSIGIRHDRDRPGA